MSDLELLLCLMVLSVASFIMGAACVGIQLEKAKRQRDEAVKRLEECENLRIEANNQAAMEYSRKCEVVEERAEFKREIEKLQSRLDSQQAERIQELKNMTAGGINN